MKALELLEELVRRPSVTPDDQGCQALIAEVLEAAGFKIEFFSTPEVTNLWATHGTGAPVVCLAGHTDVVPPGPRSAWESGPWEPTIRDGYLYGRGASDMKGSVAAMIEAAINLSQVEHAGTLALLLTSDEEGASIDGTRYVLERLVAKGVRIDAALVGEPTSEGDFGDAIKVGRRGSISGILNVKGKQGHTAYPQLALNAIHRALPAVEALVAEEWSTGVPPFPPTTFQLSGISAGTGAFNVIPGECEVRFNLRFDTSLNPERIAERVKKILGKFGIEDEVEWTGPSLPFLTRDEKLLEALTGAVCAETGITPRSSCGGGTSDGRYFAQMGIPVAEFGPSNATIHAANERIRVDELDRLVRIYQSWSEKMLATS